MLRKNLKSKTRANGARFAIVASKYNARYVNAMLTAAKALLGRDAAKLKIVRVPGAFEIPAVAAKLAGAAESGFVEVGDMARKRSPNSTAHASSK